jgi:succinyl-diaminopimelate desuccinylase
VSTASLPDLAGLVTRWVDIPSESGAEAALADDVEALLRTAAHLEVERDGAAVLARTALGRPQRVLIAGHLDTVPAAGNLPGRRDGDRVSGCGSSDMKGGLAVMGRLAVALEQPRHDLTLVFYDCEEVAASRNGLGRLAARRRRWLDADLAVLMEGTSALVEAGCQGTLRVVATLTGRRAHTSRSWLGENAVHAAGPLLERLRGYQARTVVIDGCTYREGLSAVRVDGGVAGNVVPDLCRVTVNFRFAPDRTPEQALEHVREELAGFDLELQDSAPAAPPGLDQPAVARFVAAVGEPPVGKLGWTDVARFAALGIPALNYGPGDPGLAHTAEEWVDLRLVQRCYDTLAAYLS